MNSSKKFDGTCHNCRKKGHKAKDCWAEGGGKGGQHPKGWKLRGKGKSKDKAGTADAESGEPDGVWLANAAISDNEDNWLREVNEEDIPTICTETNEDEEPKSAEHCFQAT